VKYYGNPEQDARDAKWRRLNRLEKAAPDLLEALEEMLCDAETMNPPYRNEAICERARAAIAKAKGEAK
jgi:hypothetical protein